MNVAEPDSLPNLEELQSALLDTDIEDDDVDQLMNLTTNLLRIALNDPGFPNPRKVLNSNIFANRNTYALMRYHRIRPNCSTECLDQF